MSKKEVHCSIRARLLPDTCQVAYSRSYGYNLDGSRSEVIRDDALNGSHWELYLYDEGSGRLEAVLDMESGVMHSFEWNPEGTLARWSEPNRGYDRAFGYDEEGRLVRIERDYRNGNKSLAYEYGYNSNGGKVWKRDYLNQQEYRYLCRIGCGGTPMRVYNRAMGNESWTSVEDYLQTPTFTAYNNRYGSYMDYRWLAGHWLAEFPSGEGKMVYRDMAGVTPELVLLDFPPPLYLQSEAGAFQPQALQWGVIIAGIAIIGVILAIAWASVWCWSHYQNLLQGNFGDDKYEHCMMGCMGVAGCPKSLPLGSGLLWEIWQWMWSRGSSDWLDDAVATEVGIVKGRDCKRAIIPVRPGIGSPEWNCCDRFCQAVAWIL